MRVHPGRPFRGTVHPPGDKSISHRAFLLAGLAAGQSRLSGVNPGEDCARTRTALEQLGARYERSEDGWLVTGIEKDPSGLDLRVDCGNSGTTMRVLAGAFAGFPIRAEYSGDASLSRRPVARVVEPLRRMGARVSARDGDRLPPLVVEGGGLAGIEYTSPVASAQVKSCVLLAGLRAQGVTRVTEPALSRDHTERMLPHWGVPVERHGLVSAVRGGARLAGARFRVPRDPSAALFWVVAALIVPGAEIEIEDVCLNPTRIGALRVLERMGADLEIEVDAGDGEPRGCVRVRASALRAADIEPPEVPALLDELPALGVAQAAAWGESTVRGAEELRVKESDRIETTAAGLRALGTHVETRADGWTVRGNGGRPFGGGSVESHGDHRIVMSFAVAGLAAGGDVCIEDIGAVLTSDPTFLGTLREWQP
ncbi:MAG: 3-phosphoshikimate 1-carboxyvinyltransferase [Candidatus Eisenbacteria bacterium]|nr:3-phosphoshikimate 1-carboxyvinyltransferase [Candidatus Eisenbacteria bacterium]